MIRLEVDPEYPRTTVYRGGGFNVLVTCDIWIVGKPCWQRKGTLYRCQKCSLIRLLQDAGVVA